MSERIRGHVDFEGNFEVRYSEPLDARLRARRKSFLTHRNFWISKDNEIYIYKGMTVSVYGDEPHKNGLYMFIGNPYDNDYESLNNWLNVTGNTTDGVLLDFIPSNGMSEDYIDFVAPYNYIVYDYSHNGNNDNGITFSLDNITYQNIVEIKTIPVGIDKFQNLRIKVNEPENFILKLEIYKI